MALKKETTEEVKTEETTETVNVPVVEKADDSQGIVVNEPMDLRPTELPLVIKLPADASKAQIAYANTLNAYAYKNPSKWAEKKDDKIMPNGTVVKGLISRLKDLKNAPDPVENPEKSLKVNKSSVY